MQRARATYDQWHKDAAPMGWGNKIKAFRRERGMTQAAFAEFLDVDQATVSRWERGTVDPSLSYQQALRRLFARSGWVADPGLYAYVNEGVGYKELLDRDLNVLAIAEANLEFHGITREQAIGGSMAEFPAPDHHAVAAACEPLGGLFGGRVVFAKAAVHTVSPVTAGHWYGISVFFPVTLVTGDVGLLLDETTIGPDEYRAYREEHGIIIRTLDSVSRR